MQRMWQDGLRDADDDNAATAHDYAMRLDARLGYGMTGTKAPSWLGGQPTLLTPYTEMTLTDASNRYRLGLQWQLGKRLGLDLTGEHTETDSSTPTDSILLKGELRF